MTEPNHNGPLHTMSNTPLRKLIAALRRPNALPMLRYEDPTSLRHGAALYLRKREVTFPSTRWVLEHETIKGKAAYQDLKFRAGFVIHWPSLLRVCTGLTDNGQPSFLLAEAFDFFSAWIELIAAHDCVLADLFRRGIERHRNHASPFFRSDDAPFQLPFGGLELDVFTAHIETLAKNKNFLRDLTAEMDRVFAGDYADDAKGLGYCDKGRKCPDSPCLVCQKRAWIRPHFTAFWGDRLVDSYVRNFRVISPTDATAQFSNAYTREYQYWLDAVSLAEGVSRLTPAANVRNQLVLDFSQLIRNAVEWKRDTPLLSFIDQQNPTDYWGAGNRARLYFHHLEALREHSLDEYLRLTGWQIPIGLEHPYLIVDIPKILKQLRIRAETKQRYIASTIPRGGGRSPGYRIKRKTVYLTYTDACDNKHQISAFLGFSRYAHNAGHAGAKILYVTLPWTLYDRHTEPKFTRRRALSWEGQLFWNLDAVKNLTGLDKGDINDPVYPDARHFLNWLQPVAVSMTARKFAALRADLAYQKRIVAFNDNKVETLGPFASTEDEILHKFANEKTQRNIAAEQKAAKQGKILRVPVTYTDAEREHLQILLPHRRLRAIYARLETLGLEYAKQFGYTAYLHSGYCTSNVASRRKRWLAQGVKL